MTGNVSTPLPRARFGLSPLTAVFLIVLVDILGFALILPLLPFYAEMFGASPAVVGTLVAAYAVCQLISGPFLGRLSDRIGRKPLLIVSQIGTFAGFVLLAFAPNLALVFAARILDGLTAGNISLAQAAISDFTPPKDRAKAFGKIGIAFGIGFLFGPALGGYLAQFGYSVAILSGAALSATSILATIVLLPRRTRPVEPAAIPLTASPTDGRAASAPRAKIKIIDIASMVRFFRMPALGLRLLQFFFFILAFALFTSIFALFAPLQLKLGGRPFGPEEVGYVLAYSGFLSIVLQGFLMGRLVGRFGESGLVTAGFLAMMLGYALLAFAHGLGFTLVAITFASIGSGVVRPSLMSLITQVAHRSEQGAVLGVSQSLQALAQIIAPLVGGLMIDKDLTILWAFSAALMALIGLAVGRLTKKEQRLRPRH